MFLAEVYVPSRYVVTYRLRSCPVRQWRDLPDRDATPAVNVARNPSASPGDGARKPILHAMQYDGRRQFA